MVTFVKFEENNDHEGETWVFWLQVEGNEQEIDRLETILADADEQEEYALYEDRLDEHDVDVLVAHAGRGYYNYHNKLTGTLELPGLGDPKAKDLDDLFYKGGIKGYFTV